MITYILGVLCALAIIVIDRITKIYISSNFSLGDTAEFLKGFIDISYIHNRGAAWGMLSGQTMLLLLIPIAVIIVCIIALIKYGKNSKLLFWAAMLVLSGGIGNLIDRAFNDGNVIDFLHFEFWPQFPVFNVADCAIVVGSGLLLLYFVIDTVKDIKKQKQEKENADI
ncbi:MAG: signal peptidase II [Ruminococcaceae bacterium]|nr:signal peptidase II [Oscillospiraceae bacterium]